MPSYKKRVHSQRIPQAGRPSVTPYEGAYDEKYSSDEDNIEYEVDEPDDITERSNSTVTFSEDIYDSDVIEEMKNRKPSQTLLDSDVQTFAEGPKVPKSILKDKGGKKKESLTSTFIEPGTVTEKAESADTAVSPGEVPKILEETMADELERISQAITAGKDKMAEKGENILEDLTKESDRGTSEVKGEREVVTKPMPSTISQQTDQITKTAATNQDELAKQDDRFTDSVTKPQQDIVADQSTVKKPKFETFEKVVLDKHKTTEPESFKGSAPIEPKQDQDILSEPILSKDILGQLQKISEPTADPQKQSKEFSDEQTKILTADDLGTDSKLIIKPEEPISGDIIKERQKVEDKVTKTLQDEFQIVDKLSEPIDKTTKKVEMSLKDVHVKSPEDAIPKLAEAMTIEKENATKKAVELIDDITKTVEDIFPQSAEEMVTLKLEPRGLALQPKTEETKPFQDFPTKTDSVTGLVSEEKVANGISKIIPKRADISKKIEKALEHEISHEFETIQITPTLEKEDFQKETKKPIQDVKDTFQIDKQHSKSPIELLTKTVAKDVDKLSQVATSLKDDFSQASSEIVGDIAQSIDKVSDTLKDVTEKALKTENGMVKPLRETLTAKTEKISDLITISKEEITKTGDLVVEKLEKETDKLSEKVSTVTGKAEEMLKAAQDVSFKPVEQVTHLTESIRDELSEKEEQLLKNVGKPFTETIPKEFDKVSKAIKEKSDKTENGFTKEIATVSDSVVSVKEDILKGSEKALQDSKKAFEESTTALSAGTDNLIQKGDKIIESIQKTVTESVADKPKDVETVSKDELVGTSATLQSHSGFDDYAPDEESESVRGTLVKETDKISETIKSKTGSILSDISSGLTKSIQGSFSSITGETPIEDMITDSQVKVTDGAKALSDEQNIPSKVDETADGAENQAESADKFDAKEPRLSESEDSTKPRVIFRIESEEELLSDLDKDQISPTSTEDFAEKIKKDLKASLERDKLKIEEKLSSKSGIFDISGESLSRTKELVDERLRKISEVKPPPKELEEPVKKEKPAKKTEFTETIKIGRFHVTPALVEEVVKKKKENEIAQRLKTSRQDNQEVQEEVEREISERLTEADFEEVIRELKLEGLNTEVYFLPEEMEKKKERTLKRVERRFERMASETLEKEKEEAESVSEEKLDEKREVEFQRMLSQLSSEEVAECQQEYLQLWEEGGLSSLTPTEDWESRDPDTPENELDEDSPRKSESFRGSHGTGKYGEPIKTSEPSKPDTSAKSPVSPPKPIRVSKPTAVSPGAQSVSVVEPLHVAASPSSDDKSDDVPSYVDRKKFWEQMSSSQSGETVGDLLPSALQTIPVGEVETKTTEVTKEDTISVKTVKEKFEKDFKSTESRKSFEEGGLVKSLTESYSQKIAAGELVMPAIPRPRSGVSKESPDRDTEPIQKEVTPDSTGTAIVSELEIKLKSRSPGAPITETTVIPGSTSLEKETKDVQFTIGSTVITKTTTEETKLSQEQSTGSEPEFVAKYGVESVAYDNDTFTEDHDDALPLSERKKKFEGAFDKRPPPAVPLRKSVHDRSMSLPTSELAESVKLKKKYFEEEMKKETIVEQIMTQAEEPTPKPEEKDIIPKKDQVAEKQVTHEVKKPDTLPTDLMKTGMTMVKDTLLKTKETTLVEGSGKLITTAVKTGLKLADKVPKSLNLKESHVDKSETEDNEKEKPTKTPQKKEEEQVPSITVTATAKKQIETASIGESEDTQSESDVTPEDIRVVDNDGDTPWDGSGTQSGGLSPGDDIIYPKEIGETGIGRWVGQEDLSKQIWERDDEIETHYRVPTTWERTRSEGASPKEHYVYTPEEHYPDTVWEVPVQEQLETEEITHDIPIEKQVIIEKDEEEEEEDETKVKLTEDEAKEIAEDILEYIQFEVENRASFLASESDESVQEVMHPQVTDYLHQLADKKDLDDQDIQLIESVILKKQRDRLKKTPTVGTTTSSVEITDEDLRSDADDDISSVESQMNKLEKREERDYPKLSTEISKALKTIPAQEISELDETEKTAQTIKDAEILDKTIAEVKESLEAAKEELIEQGDGFQRDPSESQFKLITEPIHELNTETEESEPESVMKEELKKMTTETEKKAEEDTKDEFEREQILKTIKTKTTEVLTSSSKTMETLKSGTKKLEPHIPEDQEINIPESFVSKKMGDTRYSSEESTRSTSLDDPIKSPPMGEDMLSSSSAEKPGELKSEKSDVAFRHSSSSSLNVQLKADRRSGTDVEPYSSSGESHYHSFEHTSSRPCSSDVEALMASNVGTTGSSEYESALSQDLSSKPATSMEYHTAVSSLSSRESIKSLDSESSGHLASVEVSSEASETLIPSAMELDKDIETPATVCSDDESSGKKFGRPPAYVTQMSAPATTSKPSVDDDFEIVSEADVVSWAGEASEEEEGTPPTGEEVIPPEDLSQKMKRSYEMTFQPEPKPIIFSESLDEFSKDSFKDKAPLGLSADESSSIVSVPDERFGSSLEETGSILSTSVSTTSDTSAVRTVIELSRTDSDKMDASLTMSGTSIDSASREELDITETHVPQPLTSEMSTSTTIHGMNKKTASVTITTSTSDEQGISNVSTQVTSVSRKSSMVDESKTDSDSQPSSRKGSDSISHANGPTQVEYVPDYDEVETKSKKTQGHRRKESTSSFVPTMMWSVTEARPQRMKADITEIEEEYGDDKYVYDITLTEKEVKNDEKKEADDSEKGEEPYEPGTEKYAQERQISEGEETEELKDFDRPQSQISRTDSESGRRPVSSILSEDQPDSELSELMKQGSSETEKDDPLERPLSPEPEDMENKDITPEFSSEAQASVTELEMEYTSACSRRDEYASHVSPIREERSELQFKGTASEESVEEEKPADQLHSQKSIDTVEEKHESETGEKEILKKKDHAEKDIPDITVTEHTPTITSQKFQYPDTKEETKEKKSVAKTPDTPASTSSRTSSSSTDQGKEYNLEEAEMKKFFHETLSEEKEVSESKEKESIDSPSSDSFEMLDKPDISDEYVIIEEVGREAQENDAEGKSIQIATRKKKIPKKPKEEEEVIVSPPPTATKMTDIKYFPSEEDSDQFLLESDSPPQPTTRRFAELIKKKSDKDEKEVPEYDPQIEQSKKWVEMQFQGEQAAKVIGAYGYEMEFERAPLEDIKEEDINELDSSSKIGSMGSQKESLGSFGSVKDSFSSTPDYDVLAGKKYFTRSGDHDDVSMSSLQEFELIEKKILENGKKSGSSSSQDSLSSKKLGTSSKSGQGDDVSQASLREFENLEHACATVVTMESKAKQEEAILSEIDEGHESQISESESCETVSAVMREKVESETEDFDKRMFEIDEIIRQAQSNVEKFSELQALEKIESMGRGDSYEEVAKVPDLELDMPLRGKPSYDQQNQRQEKGVTKTPYSTQIVTKKKMQQWRESEAEEETKAGVPAFKTKPETSKQSDLLENGGKIKSISVDSLEIQAKEKQILLEGKDDTVSLDSYKSKPEKSEGLGFSQLAHKSDSLEEFSTSLRQHESSSGDYSSSGRDDRPPPRADFLLGSSESLDPSSSTATHATYQYETDSVMSSSFTSGGSNTMVSSTDNLDLLASGQSVIDLGTAKADDWLENLEVGGDDPFVRSLAGQRRPEQGVEVQKVSFKGPDAEKSLEEWAKGLGPDEEIVEMEEVDEHGNVHVKKVLRQRVLIRPDQVGLKDMTKEGLDEYLRKAKERTVAYREKLEMGTIEPFVSEIIEPLQDDEFSHIVHKKFQMVPEVERVVFRGPDAQEALEEYMKGLNTGEDIEETEEVDEHGNVHVTRMIRQRVVVQPGKTTQEEATEMIHRKMEMPPQVERISFKGPDAEKALRDYMASVKPESEVTESEYVDEDGNVHIRKVITEKRVVRPGDLSKEELEAYMRQVESQGSSQTQHEILQLGGDAQKIVFRGPDAEEKLKEYLASIKPEGEMIEEKEVDEYGNVHVKKILRQQVVMRPDQAGRQLTKEELEQYLSSGQYEVAGSSQRVEMAPEVQKIVFKGPDAEEQLQEYMKNLKPEEVEEIEEVDEQGNVHIKRVIRQRVVMRSDELSQHFPAEESSTVQKISFTGPDAEEQLQEYMKNLKPEEVEEIEEVDEHGNVHIKKVIRQRVVMRSEGLSQQLPAEGSSIVQKISFTGPDAEEQLQEYMKNLKPEEVEEIEEVDEHGNVHIKKVIRQRVVMRSDELSQPFPTEGSSTVQKISFTGPDAEGALREYLVNLGPEDEVTEIEEKDEHGNIHVKKVLKQRVVIRPEAIGDRPLTKEELEEYLKRQTRQTTLYHEKIDLGSREPFVSETVEPLDESQYSHIVHRTVQMAPDVQKVVFKGPNAEEALKAYVEALDPGEDVFEKEEVDEKGNVHVTRVVNRKFVMKPEDLTKTGLSGQQLQDYLKSLERETFGEGGGDPYATSFHPTSSSTNQTLTEAFSSSIKLTDKDQPSRGEKDDTESASAIQKESGSSPRPPLVSDISMDDEAEHDPTEHDWRHQLEFLHAEAAEDEIDENLDEILSASSIRAQRKH